MTPKNYIYVLWNGAFRYKIGISDNPIQRIKEIRRSMKKKRVYKVLALRLYSARALEQWLHTCYSFLNRPYRKGSGKSEWFFFFLPVTPILQILATWLLERLFLILLVAGLIYLIK